jgi:hypothetical protein
MSGATTSQTTLLTSHKGVDLHAATALRVMKERLAGGERLEGLYRCELHTFWGNPEGVDMDRLLDTGRFYNPNKHHFGHFELETGAPAWFDAPAAGHGLDPRWPGTLRSTDLTPAAGEGPQLYERLLGGTPGAGLTAVDVVSFPLGQEGPVLSGVLWRLVLSGDAASAREAGDLLAVARSRKEGLLVNPHMESWLTASR